jgi:hypothetical protein
MDTFIQRFEARMILAPDRGGTSDSRAENWAAAIALLLGSVGLLMGFVPISERGWGGLTESTCGG